jgi:hypothetical protein
VAVVLAIGLVVGALVAAYEACPPFRDAVNAIGKALGEFFGPILKAISDALTFLWNNILVPLGQYIVGAFVGVWNGLTAVYNTLNGVVQAVSGALKWFFDNVIQPVAAYVGGAFIAVWDGLNKIFSAVGGTVKAVSDGMKWFYDYVIQPIAAYVGGALLGAWDAFANGMRWIYDTIIKPVIDALSWAYNNILKPVGDFLGGAGSWLQGAGNAIGGFFSGGWLPHFAEGGLVTSPTVALVGEAGPEMIVPLSQMGAGQGASVNLNSPLIVVQGSMDQETARYVLAEVKRLLRTVLVEGTSTGAPAAQKRIRKGATF